MTVLRTLPVDREPSWQSGLTGEATFPCQRRRLDGYHRQLEMQFDPELGALWMLMRPEGVPCFNLDLLADLIDGSRLIEANEGRVNVDGAPVPVLQANLMFRAVALEPGAHEIVFAYRPASWRWGLIISVAMLGVLALLLLATFLPRFERVSRDAV